MTSNFIYVSLIFIAFFVLNSYFISKVWTTKYTNFNFFESFNISLLILFVFIFITFSPIFIIFRSININSTDAVIASKWLLLIIQVTLLIIYLIGYKKIIINFAVDFKKIFVFIVFIFIYFLVWFLLLKNKNIVLDISYDFLTKGESIFNIFNSIFINIFYQNNESSFNILMFYEYVLIPFNLFLIVFSILSIVDYVEIFTFRNFKVLLVSLFILLFFCSNCFIRSDTSKFFISNNIMWSLFPLISVYSIAFKTNNEITTSSDLSLSLNMTILTLPFFYNNLYIISIFLSIIFIFYMYSMRYEACSFESLKLFSYTLLSYSMSKLVTITSTNEFIPWLLLIVALILISGAYGINRSHNFYSRSRVIDKYISNNALVLFATVEIVIVSIFFAISVGNNRMNELWQFFYKNGSLDISFILTISIIWFFSLLFFINAFINRKKKPFNTPILLSVFAVLLVFTPFFKTDLLFLISDVDNINVLFDNMLVMVSIPMLISYIGMSSNKINDIKNKKMYRILYISFEIVLTLVLIANCCLYITYILGVTGWTLF